MRRADLVIVLVLVAFGGFIAYEALGVQRSAARGAPTEANTAPAQSASQNEVVVASGGSPAPRRDIAAIRKHLLDHERGTFIAEILAARDSNIARWTARKDKPVPVWIDEHSPLAGPGQVLASNVRRAFADWGQAGVPLAFTFVTDSSRAEVKVHFIDHFDEIVSGRTLWTRDMNWWIIGGAIQLAVRNATGNTLTDDQVYAIALHEVGHLLGLDHTADTTAIMTPRVRVLSLSAQDVATMRLIYELPPGSVRQ